MNAKTYSEIIWRKWVGEHNDPGSDPETWLPTLQSCQLERGFKNPTPAAEHKVWKLQNHCPNLCFQLHFAILKEDIISPLVFMISFNTCTHIFLVTGCDCQLLFPPNHGPLSFPKQTTEGVQRGTPSRPWNPVFQPFHCADRGQPVKWTLARFTR